MTQPALRTPALDARAQAALATEFARALESPGLRPLLPRLTGALLPRFARYYDQLLHLPRRTRRALQRQWKRSLAALALLLALGQAPAWAASLTVNSLADTATPGDTECTLREAIGNANGDSDTTSGDCVAGAGADTIGFSVSGTIVLGSTLPSIPDGTGLTIDGTGQSVTVSGNNAVRVMFVNGGATLHLRNLTVANGNALFGGGIQNNGTLTVTNSTFSGNNAFPAIARASAAASTTVTVVR